MGKIIKLKRGLKQNLPVLAQGEPAYVTDDKELYIGTPTGNVKVSKNAEVEEIATGLEEVNTQLITIDSDLNTANTQLALKASQSDLNIVTADLAQIAQNENNAFALGLDGKSLVDVGILMQSFLNLAINSGIKKVVFPKGSYILSKPLNANVDDLEIDFNGSTLKWRGTATINTVSSYNTGIITVQGTKGSVATVTEFIPKEELLNVSLDGDSFFSNVIGCKVKTNNLFTR